ncbi:hypothetical protein HNQ91_002962 [Filimonas zeae]|uniref:Uncharacterized protein n=1 Tax=Filimonas zeae TaxID=1737353 RepID=A0A917IZ20_9BACT|nr:hypothetical protein [Filimonas zeae]MDR6339897.1 hypothetical protein [Filimonas zeae]GGH70198.1 hypothetical protein GCM10011379_28220 [Filimonas zeae]
MTSQNFNNVMALSWEIQRNKKYKRSRALLCAWAIYLNEDIMVFRLVRKHRHRQNIANPQRLTLFKN